MNELTYVKIKEGSIEKSVTTFDVDTAYTKLNKEDDDGLIALVIRRGVTTQKLQKHLGQFLGDV